MPFTMDKAVPGYKRLNDAPPGGTWKLARLAPPPSGSTYHRPSARVLELLGAEYILAVDIETHDWKEERKGDRHAGHYGKYGFFCRCNPEDLPYARIVQIGWNLGYVRDIPTKKEYVIKPEGFCVSEKATAVHGIIQEIALSLGSELRDTLQELMADVRICAERGGRVVAYQLEHRA